MFCGNCGTRLDDDALFCAECGTPIASSTSSLSSQTVSTDGTDVKPLYSVPLSLSSQIVATGAGQTAVATGSSGWERGLRCLRDPRRVELCHTAS